MFERWAALLAQYQAQDRVTEAHKQKAGQKRRQLTGNAYERQEQQTKIQAETIRESRRDIQGQ